MTLYSRIFDDTEIRIVRIDGDPWLVAADVADALNIGRTQEATRRLDDDEKGVSTIHTPGGPQEMTVISELGIYDGLSSAEPSRLLSVYALLADTSRRKTRSKLLSGWAAVVESGTLNQAELGRSV